MTNNQAKIIIDILANHNIEFDDGLSIKEIEKIQRDFEFTFPPDLSGFLQINLPISNNFVNWREAINSDYGSKKVKQLFNIPWEGMVFDLRNNNFWIKNWGEKPKTEEEQLKIALRYFNTFPKLIPVYAHRFIPSIPCEAGNPIFSVHQMDIIYYGNDLASYFAKEFEFILPSDIEKINSPKKIEFWSEWVENGL